MTPLTKQRLASKHTSYLLICRANLLLFRPWLNELLLAEKKTRGLSELKLVIPFFNCGSLKVISISATVLKFPNNEKRSHLVQTSACGRLLAPLAVRLALRLRRAFQNIAVITEEGHHVVQVEAVANGAAVDRAARMTAANSWNTKEENDQSKVWIHQLKL